MKRDNVVVAATLLAIGIALSGWFVGRALYAARASERYVSVRGFAEREVPANLALWPIVFSVTSNDLGVLQQRVDDGVTKVRAFLADRFSAEEVSVAAPRVQDREAQGRRNENGTLDRYTAEVAVTVRTSKIDEAKSAMARTGELIKQGVAVIRSYEYNTEYQYTALDQIKPAMIGEATKDARRAAEQFASDSGSQVTAIRSAQQGLFTVEDRDPFSPEHKKVRVVTTVTYYLGD